MFPVNNRILKAHYVVFVVKNNCLRVIKAVMFQRYNNMDTLDFLCLFIYFQDRKYRKCINNDLWTLEDLQDQNKC